MLNKILLGHFSFNPCMEFWQIWENQGVYRDIISKGNPTETTGGGAKDWTTVQQVPRHRLQTLQGLSATLIPRSIFPGFFTPSSYHWKDHLMSSWVRLGLHYLLVAVTGFQNINGTLVSMFPSNSNTSKLVKEAKYGRQPLTWPTAIPASQLSIPYVIPPFACGLDLVIRKSNVTEVLECEISLPRLGYEKTGSYTGCTVSCSFKDGSPRSHGMRQSCSQTRVVRARSLPTVKPPCENVRVLRSWSY